MIYSYAIFYSIYLSLFCYIASFVYAVLVSKSKTVDTMTWTVFSCAFGFRSIYILATLPFRSESLQVISIFPLPYAVAFAVADVGVALLFMVAMFRKYRTVVSSEHDI